jgi:hypothetical protein
LESNSPNSVKRFRKLEESRYMLEFAAALDSARTLTFVDEIARDLWRAYGAGEIGESDAESVAARIEEARQRIRPRDAARTRAPAVPLAAVSMFPARKRRCVSPDRAASRARRRRLAYSGPLPPALAAGFTVGQLAALRIVADEVRARGSCLLTLGEIATRAAVGPTRGLSSNGTENRHKLVHASSTPAVCGSRNGLSSPLATVSGSVKA